MSLGFMKIMSVAALTITMGQGVTTLEQDANWAQSYELHSVGNVPSNVELASHISQVGAFAMNPVSAGNIPTR